MNTSFAGPIRVAFVVVLTAATWVGRAAESPISVAEQRVFVDDHLGGVGSSKTLRYRFRQTGSLDKPFDDTVVMTIRPKPPSGRAVEVAYLTGERNVKLPAIDDAKSNPVILYFLEQDVREMHRRLGGSENYFRRRIRLAFAEGAEVNRTSVVVDGRPIEATEIVIRPFVADPMKARLGAHESKTYAFALSDRVPGQVVRLRSLVAGEAGAPRPMLEELLTFEKAEQ